MWRLQLSRKKKPLPTPRLEALEQNQSLLILIHKQSQNITDKARLAEAATVLTIGGYFGIRHLSPLPVKPMEI